MELNSLKKQKHASSSYVFRQSFMGTVVNLALPFLHGGSLEVVLTVPLESKDYNLCLI